MTAMGRAPANGQVTQPALVVLRALGLGDLLTGLPALRMLRSAFPEHRITLATTPAVASLARTWAPVLLDGVVECPPLGVLPSDLLGPEMAVNLHGSGPQSHQLLQALRPGRLLAFANDEAAEAGPEWDAPTGEVEHEIARWCRLVADGTGEAIPDLLASGDALDLPVAPSVLPNHLAAIGTAATLVHPGSASPTRRWPTDRWSCVVAQEVAAGRPVVMTGSPAERATCLDIARSAALPKEAVLAGKTNLVQLAGLVSIAARIVSSDTGISHLATALRRPSVTLFGPVSPAEWGPPIDRPWHRPLWRGRTSDPNADTIAPALDAITPADVIAELTSAPNRSFSVHERPPRLDSQRSAGPPCSEATAVLHSVGATP